MTRIAALNHWLLLQMTGLDVDTDHILEMACLVTDKDLTIVAEVRLL